mmetsp:Transcript_10515/g.17027  ORF Transcript_10515/g.17027 Transcript_10515/m.17027 type:complete len:274 (+) Transcript_10515:560-1381(+)
MVSKSGGGDPAAKRSAREVLIGSESPSLRPGAIASLVSAAFEMSLAKPPKSFGSNAITRTVRSAAESPHPKDPTFVANDPSIQKPPRKRTSKLGARIAGMLLLAIKLSTTSSLESHLSMKSRLGLGKTCNIDTLVLPFIRWCASSGSTFSHNSLAGISILRKEPFSLQSLWLEKSLNKKFIILRLARHIIIPFILRVILQTIQVLFTARYFYVTRRYAAHTKTLATASMPLIISCEGRPHAKAAAVIAPPDEPESGVSSFKNPASLRAVPTPQ